MPNIGFEIKRKCKVCGAVLALFGVVARPQVFPQI